MSRPYVWQMVREAVTSLGGTADYGAIRQYIAGKYDGVNRSTLNSQITVCSVNAPSRVHYPENSRPRTANTERDCLFRTALGVVTLYNPAVHGEWEISRDESGKLSVAQKGVSEEVEVAELAAPSEEVPDNLTFALESHLRDFLKVNLHSVPVNGRRLHLFRDSAGRDGVEYPTGVGPIDILAEDEVGGLVVFELKLDRGPDRAVGQLLRYMGWVNAHLAGGRPVSGVVVAARIDSKLKYAISAVPNVSAFEYAVRFDLQAARLEPAAEIPPPAPAH